MISPGEDIRIARDIYALLYGAEAMISEVNVKAWMVEAEKTRKMLRCTNFIETRDLLKTIPYKMNDEIAKLTTKNK